MSLSKTRDTMSEIQSLKSARFSMTFFNLATCYSLPETRIRYFTYFYTAGHLLLRPIDIFCLWKKIITSCSL
jgi:hypothetical protein